MTIPLFALCAHAPVPSTRMRSLLADLTACGFGIYMVHYFFAGPCVELMRSLGVPISVQIPAAAVVAMAASWLLVEGLRRVLGRRARYVVG